jgi:hypothetical protein
LRRGERVREPRAPSILVGWQTAPARQLQALGGQMLARKAIVFGMGRAELRTVCFMIAYAKVSQNGKSSELAKINYRLAMLNAMGVVVVRLLYLARDLSILKQCVSWLPKRDRCPRRDGRRFIKVSAGYRLGTIAPTLVRGLPDMLLPADSRDERKFSGVNTHDPYFYAFGAREPRPAWSAGRETMYVWRIREERR